MSEVDMFKECEKIKHYDDLLCFGFIYVLSNEGYKENLFKIGYTTQNVKHRVNQLNGTGVPGKFKIEFLLFTPFAEDVEKLIHDFLHVERFNGNREFFQCDLSNIIEKIWLSASTVESMALDKCRIFRRMVIKEGHLTITQPKERIKYMNSGFPREYFKVAKECGANFLLPLRPYLTKSMWEKSLQKRNKTHI